MLLRICKTVLTGMLVALSTAGIASATSYPERTIKIVVPWAASGAGDFLARVISEKISVTLGEAVIVENKPGAATNIGTRYVQRATPDGYTLLLASSNNTVNTTLFPNLDIDFENDFIPISNIGLAPSVLVVNKDLPVNSVQDLIEYVNGKSEPINYGSSGHGSASHLSVEMFKQKVGIDATAIPYKGAAPAVLDLVAGRLDMMITVVPAIKGHIDAGTLKALCVLADDRLEALPNVPTADEVGLTGLRSNIWYGLVAPAGTPTDVVQLLQEATAKALSDPGVKKRLAEQGTVPIGDSSSAFATVIKNDTESYANLIRTAGIDLAN